MNEMSRQQIEKIAVGYPVPTDWIAILLYKYNYDTAKVHEILCKNQSELLEEVQKAIII